MLDVPTSVLITIDTPFPVVFHLYIKNVVNSSSKFENKTYKTLKKKEHIIYESTNSMESRHYYRKQLKSLSIDVRLLDAGLIKKEDYIQIYIGIHKADLKFV